MVVFRSFQVRHYDARNGSPIFITEGRKDFITIITITEEKGKNRYFQANGNMREIDIQEVRRLE